MPFGVKLEVPGNVSDGPRSGVTLEMVDRTTFSLPLTSIHRLPRKIFNKILRDLSKAGVPPLRQDIQADHAGDRWNRHLLVHQRLSQL